MANSLSSYVDKFTTRLDKIACEETCTSALNLNTDLVGELSGAGSIEIADIAMQGLGNYDRATGFPAGDVSLTWTKYQLAYDRGREFSIDKIDDEERAAIISANVMAEFTRTKVVPEIDAIRFARMSAAAVEAGTTASAAVSTASNALSAVRTAEARLEDNGADLSRCVLFCTRTFRNLLADANTYQLTPGQDPSNRIAHIDDIAIQPVPQARFYSVLEMLDGVTNTAAGEGTPADNQLEGGFAKASTGKNLNFMIVDPAAVAAITKMETLRYFAPDVNQAKQAHLWQFRIYHDLLVYKNKKGLIYSHVSTS